MPESQDELPLRVYTPDPAFRAPRLLLQDMWAALRASWELAVVLFGRDLKAQYRQSFIGYAWLLVTPLGTTLLWFLLRGSGIARIPDTGIPYPAFVLIGTLLWETFALSVQAPLQQLGASRGLLVKLRFAYEAPVIAGFVGIAFESLVRLFLLVPVFVLVRLQLSWTLVLFPLGYAILMLLGAAIGLLLVPVGLLYSDVNRGVGLVLRLGMYLTPVVYPLAHSGPLAVLNRVNPVTFVLDTARALLVGAPVEHVVPAVLTTLVAVVALFLGWVVLHVTMPIVIERMGM